MEPAQHPITLGTPTYWKDQIRCQVACPVHTDARGYVRAIAEGNFELAYLIARGPNPLASICGRICGAPCEASCRRGMIDEPIAIRALKRVVTERFGPYRAANNGDKPTLVSGPDHAAYLQNSDTDKICAESDDLMHVIRLYAESLKRPTGQRIAIIGAGPAGLACAHDLALLGLRPTILESEAMPAGMLVLGVPEYRLPRDLIKAEIEVIQALGVEIRCGVQVGRDVTLSSLRDEYDAVVIAVGCKRSRGLSIPGIASKGVYGGVEFLRSVAIGEPVRLGGRVIVIGGGSVAYDVSRTVLRQEQADVSREAARQAGEREVTLVCLESAAEMPAETIDIKEGEEEGVLRKNGWGPVEILTKPGPDGPLVEGVRFRRCVRVYDENRAFRPIYDNTQLVDLPADTVLLSVGQAVDLSFLEKAGDNVRLSAGQIAWDANTQMTSYDGVFVAGDVAYGPKLVIDAIASGKHAARSVYEYCTGARLHRDAVQFHVDLGPYLREPDLDKNTRVPLPALPVRDRIRFPRAIVDLGYTLDEARAEAGRCLDCGVDTLWNTQCTLCGACVEVCPTHCLQMPTLLDLQQQEPFQRLAESDHYHLKKNTVVLRDEDRSVVVAPQARIEANEDMVLFKDEDTCIRCGLCAQVCPTRAISMQRLTFSEGWSCRVNGAARA
ncbi:MAG: FAD-dependent oxidoreductase [Armatimonadetes bacterium]|nr:FAD-dependent oxidoreductase [Armatimonadota bacterium]MDE2206432.1 FAD-dependent oxidoreductase [Armatimonadota bacterium]